MAHTFAQIALIGVLLSVCSQGTCSVPSEFDALVPEKAFHKFNISNGEDRQLSFKTKTIYPLTSITPEKKALLIQADWVACSTVGSGWIEYPEFRERKMALTYVRVEHYRKQKQLLRISYFYRINPRKEKISDKHLVQTTIIQNISLFNKDLKLIEELLNDQGVKC